MTTVSTDHRRGINSGAAIKVACVCATTANITLSGEQTIDGITTSSTRVFVKNQTDATEIGIYKSAASAWVREPDFDGTYDVTEGTIVPVSRGTVNAATFWRVTNIGAITVGTTKITVTALPLDANAILSDGSVSYAADFLPATTATHDMGSRTFQWEDVHIAGDLVQAEQADHSVTPAAGYGQWWTRSDTPSVGVYTDDAGTDYDVSTVVGIAGPMLPASGQVAFPATQNASANANTLDDYQEGTWTAVLQDNSFSSGEGQSAGAPGNYTKIGNRIFFDVYLEMSALGTLSGDAYINGLPVAATSNTAVHCSFAANLAITANTSVGGRIISGQTYIQLHNWDATTGTTRLQISEITASGSLLISGHYNV